MALYHTLTGWGVDWRDGEGHRQRKFIGSKEAAAAEDFLAELRAEHIEVIPIDQPTPENLATFRALGDEDPYELTEND